MMNKSGKLISTLLLLLSAGLLYSQQLNKLTLTPPQKNLLMKARIVSQQTASPEKIAMRSELINMAHSGVDNKIEATIYYLVGNCDRYDKKFTSAIRYYKKAIKLWPEEYGNPKKTATSSYIISCYQQILPRRLMVMTVIILILSMLFMGLILPSIRFNRSLAVRLLVSIAAWIAVCFIGLLITRLIKVPVIEEEVAGLAHFYVFLWIGFFQNPFFWMFVLISTLSLAAVVLLAHVSITTGWRMWAVLALMVVQTVLLFITINDATFYISGLIQLKPLLADLSFGSGQFILLRIAWLILPAAITGLTAWSLYHILKKNKMFYMPLGLGQAVTISFGLLLLFTLVTSQRRYAVNGSAQYYHTEIEDYIFNFPERFVNLLQDNIDNDDNLYEFVNEETIIVDEYRFYQERRDDVRVPRRH